MNLLSYSHIYDFSLIEKALQSYFIAAAGMVAPPDEGDDTREEWVPDAGKVAVFTAFQAAIFQKARPRVACFLNNIGNAATPPKAIADHNGALRNVLWRGNLTLEIITEPDYAAHTALRSQVAALGEMIAPMVANPATAIGVNQYLQYHRVNLSVPQGMDTSISIGEGFYGSQFNYQLTFSVPPSVVTAITD